MPQQQPTLRDMILKAVASGTSYKQLAESATDPETGKVASHSFLNDLANGNVNRIPEPKNLRAIAAGLGVPYERVRKAAIAQWLPPTSDADIDTDTDAEREAQIAELKRLRAEIDAVLKRKEDPGRRAG